MQQVDHGSQAAQREAQHLWVLGLILGRTKAPGAQHRHEILHSVGCDGEQAILLHTHTPTQHALSVNISVNVKQSGRGGGYSVGYLAPASDGTL